MDPLINPWAHLKGSWHEFMYYPKPALDHLFLPFIIQFVSSSVTTVDFEIHAHFWGDT
jgi:hypothetical protein